MLFLLRINPLSSGICVWCNGSMPLLSVLLNKCSQISTFALMLAYASTHNICKNYRISDTLNFWDGQHTHGVLTHRHLFPHPAERKCGKMPISHMHQFLFIPFCPLTHPSLLLTHSEWSIVEYKFPHECKWYLQSCMVSFELSEGAWYNSLILTRSKLKGNTDPKSLEIFSKL